MLQMSHDNKVEVSKIRKNWKGIYKSSCFINNSTFFQIRKRHDYLSSLQPLTKEILQSSETITAQKKEEQ